MGLSENRVSQNLMVENLVFLHISLVETIDWGHGPISSDHDLQSLDIH